MVLGAGSKCNKKILHKDKQFKFWILYPMEQKSPSGQKKKSELYAVKPIT